MTIWDIFLLIGAFFLLAKGMTDIAHRKVETFAGLTGYRTVFRGRAAIASGIVQIFIAVGIVINALFVPND